MKKIKTILFSVVISLISFVGIANYNAEESPAMILEKNITNNIMNLSWYWGNENFEVLDAPDGVARYNVYRSLSPSEGEGEDLLVCSKSSEITNCRISNLEEGVEYTIHVEALTSDGNVISTSSMNTIIESFGDNFALEGTVNGPEISLYWEAIEDAEIYKIFRMPLEGEEAAKPIYVGETTNTTYSFEADVLDEEYTLFVMAFFDDETSIQSQNVNVTPTNVFQVNYNVRGTSVDLNWEAVENAVEYQIFRMPLESEEVSKPIYVGSSDSPSYTIENLETDTYYTLYVVAYYEDETALTSESITVKTLVDFEVSSYPSGKTISLWWAPYEGAEVYKVFRMPLEGEEAAKPIYMGETTETDYYYDDLLPNEDYSFFVSAISEDENNSFWVDSESINFTTNEEIENLDIIITDDVAELTWDELPGAQEYNIYMYCEDTQEEDYELVGTTTNNNFTIDHLNPNKTYAFYIEAPYEDNNDVFLAFSGTYWYSTERFNLTKTSATIEGITDKVFNGEEQVQSVTVKFKDILLTEGIDYRIEYDENVNIGTAVMTIIGQNDYQGVLTKTFKITPIPISTAGVTLSKNAYYWADRELKPGVTVKIDDQLLVNGKDYTVAYKNNKNPGIASVIITGKGLYGSTVTKTFDIVRIPASSFKVTGIVNKTYNGKNQTQRIVVKSYGRTLVLNKDYTIKPQNNKAIGTATVVIKGKGNYAGEINKTFKIYPAKIKIKKLTTKKKQLSIIYYTTTGGVYYEAAYNMKGNKTIYTVTKTVPRAFTIKNLKSGKVYYTKIRACKKVGNKVYCSAWSPVKSIKVK